jgi:hypothetical protein
VLTVVPDTFTNYFIANVGASAALIGLLFVAVTVAPERIFGQEGTAKSRLLAGSAFVALLDAFFVSLVALVPGANIGYAALVMSIIALINTLSMGRHLWDDRRVTPLAQGLALLVGSVVIYVYQITYAVALLRQARDSGAVTGLAYLLLGAYSLSVARTWTLLGAGHEGLLSLFGFVRAQGDPASDTGAGSTPGPAPAPVQ